VDTCCTEAN